MSAADPIMQPPRSILLATDLDSHSDRALDRATQLARQWHATLHVVHVRQPAGDGVDPLWPVAAVAPAGDGVREDRIERRIRRDLRDPPQDVVIHVVVGEPADGILDIAARERCELIVLGNRGAPFAGIIVRSTTAQLLRRSPHSLLIVKTRPRGTYERVLVGTDFTAESRHGFETAAAWFAAARFSLVHALDIPYRSLLLEGGREPEFARMEHDAMQAFVAQANLSNEVRQHLETQIEYGPPEIMLHDYGDANDVDLTVVGVLKRGLAFRLLVGGNATRIVQLAPGDILMVRAEGVA